MDDLISRAALLKECAECQKTDPRFEERGWSNNFINDAGEPSTEWYCVEDIIENAPAVDAVQVVRCRDCKYYDVEPGGDVMMCYEGLGWTQPNDYCSTGERKEDEHGNCENS